MCFEKEVALYVCSGETARIYTRAALESGTFCVVSCFVKNMAAAEFGDYSCQCGQGLTRCWRVPQHTLEPLQKVQNALCSTRLIFNLSRHDHISPVASLIQLHWLPVRGRIQYKLCSLMYGVHSSLTVARRTSRTSFNPTRRRQRIWSAETTDYVLPRLRIPSLLSEVSLTPVRGTACPSQSAEHHPRQPSNDVQLQTFLATVVFGDSRRIRRL